MKRFIFILIALASVGILLANKSQRSIKQEQQRTNKEISETTQKINNNKRQTKEQISLLNKLSAEIQEKSDSISILKQSIDSIDNSMSHLNDSIIKMENNLSVLRQKYGETLRQIRASRHSSNNSSFLLSSNSFSDAFRRMRYLRQFASWQSGKTLELQNAIAMIGDAKNSLVKLHSNKAYSIKKVSATQSALQNDEKRQEEIVANLGKERASLEAYLKEKRQEARNLDAQLNRLIAQQQKEKKAKKQTTTSKSASTQSSKKKGPEKKQNNKPTTKAPNSTKQQPPNEDVALNQPANPDVPSPSPTQQTASNDFESHKGRLSYPVIGKYRVVGKFGRHQHPQFPNIQTENNGIDIELLSSGSAKAIFDGTVSAIFRQPGYNTIVMIRHGQYLTIYANLASISVKTGDDIKANQIIGNVYSDPEENNRRIMHFEIRKETVKLNPQDWIK